MYLVFDTETTGFPYWNQQHDFPLQARICSIAAILLDENFEEMSGFHTLIKPDNWTISSGAFGAHGISIEDCEQFGIPIKNALGMMTKMMEKASYFACHGVKFDTFMLDIELLLAGFPTYNYSSQGLCTLKASRKICELRNIKKRGPGLNLSELYKECTGEEHASAHRAMGDVQATAKCLAYLIENQHIIVGEIVEEAN